MGTASEIGYREIRLGYPRGSVSAFRRRNQKWREVYGPFGRGPIILRCRIGSGCDGLGANGWRRDEWGRKRDAPRGFRMRIESTKRLR